MSNSLPSELSSKRQVSLRIVNNEKEFPLQSFP